MPIRAKSAYFQVIRYFYINVGLVKLQTCVGTYIVSKQSYQKY